MLLAADVFYRTQVPEKGCKKNLAIFDAA